MSSTSTPKQSFVSNLTSCDGNAVNGAQGPVLADKVAQISSALSDMEEADTNKTKVSDSAYSTSCNSRSQRSSGSSKSRNSGSSNSSGYGGHASTLGSVTEFTQPPSKRSKDKKKKGSRSSSSLPAPTIERLKEDEEASSSTKAPEIPPQEEESDKNGNASGLGLGPELVFHGIASPHDNEALQMAAINQTLSFIKQLKSSTEELNIPTETVEERAEQPEAPSTTFTPVPEKTSRTKEEFTVIISMTDGIVKHTSSGILDVLGFPHDMWVGRSITDFVQVKDRAAFASHITSGVASPLTQVDKADCGRRSPFFCSLRCYRGLKKCGFGVKDKSVHYRPCQLMLAFREHSNGFPLTEEGTFDRNDAGSSSNSAGREQPRIYLVVTVNPISSAYKYADETQILPKFGTRLLASTHLSDVDPECVPYLGFLPQDMLGRSVLEFYHPEDMPFMKDVYEAVLNKSLIVIKEQGSPFLSKPYRFRTQNGGYVLLETEWSSFSNPWSRKLEFIIAQHRVLKGPPNPDVFAAPPEGDTSVQMSEEVIKESKVIQEEIQNMLNEAMTSTTDNSKKRNLSRHCKVLASFMDSMMEENKKSDLRLEVPPEEQSFSERDSVMLGEISPHHEYYDSKSSSETPPSYNQLNYNDNIQRFFESKPKTTRSDESNKEKPGSPGKNSPEQDSSLGSGDSGSGGGSGETTGSHDSATSSSHNSYLQPMLTEALLTRHNENMEKRLVQRHREQRSKGDKRDKYHKTVPGPHGPHGVKRIGSQSWENDSFKGSKHLHVENQGTAQPGQLSNAGPSVPVTDAIVTSIPTVVVTSCATTTTGNTSTTTVPPPLTTSIPSIYQNSSSSVWPPFSVTVTPLPSSQVVTPFSSYPLVGPGPAHMMPMYYMGLGPQEHPGSPHLGPRNPFLPPPAYIPTGPSPHLQLVYQHLPQSLLYSPISMLQPAPTMLPTSLFPPGACLPTEPTQSNQMQTQAQASTRSVVGQPSQLGQQPQPLQPNQQQQSQQQLQQQQPTLQQQSQQPPKPTNTESGSCDMQCKFQRPPSQATSVKAEPGSALGSVASASRRALSVSSNKNKSISICDNLSPDEDKTMEDSNQCSEQRGDEGSYYSSLCSYLCTDNSDASMRSCKDARHEEGCSCWSQNDSISNDSNALSRPRPVRSGPPPWMKDVSMTQDVIFGYQLDKKELNDVLNSDLVALSNIEQPSLVNEQLNQLYQDLTIEGAPGCLALEEGITTSSGSSSEDQSTSEQIIKTKKKRRSMEYGRLIMIFEEDAPMPPPMTPVATTVT
ncbi:period circadian protein isoform X3 [Frankliniella occidentalis]|uniref:Period circadian protein n=1 Tax=Frankliniella occidentalis TaxID=133901 RepID=A0A6J1SHI1_FRAOC|nr:period circadian protein isoform X3 [Frankliniella occidentalis]